MMWCHQNGRDRLAALLQVAEGQAAGKAGSLSHAVGRGTATAMDQLRVLTGWSAPGVVRCLVDQLSMDLFPH